MLTSKLCTQADMESDWHRRWCHLLGEDPALRHRKVWEHTAVSQALEERGALRRGHRGVVFGAGQEPLPAAFAARGIDVLVTDLDHERAVARGWATTGQHVDEDTLGRLNERGLCPPSEFARHVQHRTVDMNTIPQDIAGYDFCWSICSLEHLGSLRAGEDFIEASLGCLKPGGVAVHTTEYTLSSNDETLETGGTVLYRRRDIESLIRRLEHAGHAVEAVDFDPGEGELDRYIDPPPYRFDPHLRLLIAGHACTSIMLIVTKGAGLPSTSCHQEDFRPPWRARWSAARVPGFARHRETREFSYIARAIHVAGLLREGSGGLAFAVGEERLPALFASRG